MAIVTPIIGGLIIGLAAAGFMLMNGRIAGVSGIVGGLFTPRAGDIGWRAAFVAGIVAAGATIALLFPTALNATLDRSLWVVVAAGLLVGFGARLGSGCTSGHGICGLGRLSPRSAVSVGVFTVSAMATVFLYRLTQGGV